MRQFLSYTSICLFVYLSICLFAYLPIRLFAGEGRDAFVEERVDAL